MALKDILVHVDSSKACPGRLKAAVGIASAHGAHLTGLYVLPTYTLPGFVEADIGTELRAAQEKVRLGRSSEAEKLFKDATDRADIACEWRSAEGLVGETLAEHGRYVDLVIAGQHQSDDAYSVEITTLNDLVMRCGRPVLNIPYIGAPPAIGKNVLIAWNASREAVRAVNDALPLLEQAEKVHVMAVNPPGGAGGEGDIPCADICLHLARHGVPAEAHTVRARDIEVGDMLLSRAADEDVDLIVTGAWSHSRFREIVLGGVTRALFDHMTVPVLMSH
jgi:nucleotide-binding universal stress UspA family protein